MNTAKTVSISDNDLVRIFIRDEGRTVTVSARAILRVLRPKLVKHFADCKECGSKSQWAVKEVSGGLCWGCYYRPSLRKKYGLSFVRACKHCGERVVYARDLCRTCHRDQEVRTKYPCLGGPCAGEKIESGREEAALIDSTQLQPVQPVRPATCRHDKPDGLCAQCEREERIQMKMLENT